MSAHKAFKLFYDSDPEIRAIFEHYLCRCAKHGNCDEVHNLLTVYEVNVNCFDKNGVTPLQYAAFYGKYFVCKLLLDNGADVNVSRHHEGYNALTFSVIAGELEVVCLLIEHGADINQIKCIIEVPARVELCVNSYDLPKIIKYFVTFEEIFELTELVPGLRSIWSFVHKFANMTNVHPVRLALFMQDNAQFIGKCGELSEAFRLLGEKKMNEGNDVLSLKYYLFSHVLSVMHQFITCIKQLEYITSETVLDKPKRCLIVLIKNWIKGRDSDGFPMVIENMLRSAMDTYPYLKNEAVANICQIFEEVKKGDEPSAIALIRGIINILRWQNNKLFCDTCSEPLITRQCGECYVAHYCGIDCQNLHLATHKTVCKKLLSESHCEEAAKEKPKQGVSRNRRCSYKSLIT